MSTTDRHDRVQGFLIAGLAFLAPLMGSQISIRPLPLPAGGILEGLMGGAELPQLAQAVLGALACAIVGLSFGKNRVVQLPHWRILFPLVGFIGIFGASILFSRFRFESAQAWLQWVSYAAAFVAAISAGGRTRNVLWALSALTVSCAILGAKAIVEYGQMRGIDPNWRVFGGWVNPNALAGMLILVFPLAVALMLLHTRHMRLLFGTAAFLIGCGVILTQSLGGLLCFAVSLVVLGFLAFRASGWKPNVGALIPIIAVLAFAATLKFSGTGSGALNRVGAISSNQEQSQGFRKLLWQSAWNLLQSEPEGLGVGTFRYYSAKPGLITSTQLAHQSYLQIGAEGGPLPLVIFLAFLGQAVFEVGRLPKRKQDSPNSILRAAITAGLIASLAHGLIDSDFYYFGIGLSFFLLLGIGQQIAIDGSVPESISKEVRRGVAAFAALAALGLIYFGFIELKKCQMLAAAVGGNTKEATAILDSLGSFAPIDPEVPYFQAVYGSGAGQVEQVISHLKRSYELGPKISTARALAVAYRKRGNTSAAIDTLDGALRWDPNNLQALRLLVETLAESEQMTKAELSANKLIVIEGTSYFKVRSIPEIVPTQTFWARLFLAKRAKSQRRIRELLLPAIEGYQAFAEVTIPRMLSFARAGMSDSGTRNESALDEADEAVKLIEQASLTPAERVKIDAAKAAFAKARAELAKAQS